MTPSAARVIYPELPDPLTPGDLQQLFSPSFDERKWAPTGAIGEIRAKSATSPSARKFWLAAGPFLGVWFNRVGFCGPKVAELVASFVIFTGKQACFPGANGFLTMWPILHESHRVPILPLVDVGNPQGAQTHAAGCQIREKLQRGGR